jgi:hypothetical protein
MSMTGKRISFNFYPHAENNAPFSFSTLAFVSVKPEFVLGYSVVYTNCSANFRALTLPKVACEKSGAHALHKITAMSVKMMVFWTFMFAMPMFMT